MQPCEAQAQLELALAQGVEIGPRLPLLAQKGGDGAGPSGRHRLVRIVQQTLHLRVRRTDRSVLATAKAHFDPLMATRLIGVTVQLDESPGQVYDGKHSNLHPLFNKA